ncbi:MAG: hypothetical protein AAGA54_23420 [Myxococcota bacterium]
MTEDPRTPLLRQLDALGVWDVAAPPPDFADRVLTQAPPSRRTTAWRVAALAVAAALVAVVGWALLHRPTPSRGSVVAEQRRTVNVSETAVVLEPGAALSWTHDDGLALDQARGSAFYRVDPTDAPVTVHTPAGTVEVTGTCFSIDLTPTSDPMRQNHKALALGGAIAVAATVTVYEGSTVFANESGAVTLQAGEQARATGFAPPTRVRDLADASVAHATPTAELATLRAENRRQASELERLRTTLDAAGHANDPEVDDAPPPSAGRFAAWGPPIPAGFDHYAPTDEALLQMAECGIVAWDQPPVWADDEQPDPGYLDALGLDEEERAAFQGAFDAFQRDTVAQARAFYVELGGDPTLAEAIDPSELLGMVYGRTDLDAREDGRIAMAMERAGLAEPPASVASASERFLRWDANLGHAFEDALAEQLGPERAHALRDARGGWPGKRTGWADICSDRE